MDLNAAMHNFDCVPVKAFEGVMAATLVAPFASITWSRFNGSPALPRRTLSLRPGFSGPVGSPQDDWKLRWTAGHVKDSSPTQQRGFVQNRFCRHEEKFTMAVTAGKIVANGADRTRPNPGCAIDSAPRNSVELPRSAALLRRIERKKLFWPLDKPLISAQIASPLM